MTEGPAAVQDTSRGASRAAAITGCQECDGVSVNLVVCMGPRRRLRQAHLALHIGTLQTSPDSFVSHPSLDKHGQEMNVVLQ